MAAAHFAEVHPAFAQAGDLAVVPGEDGIALGIVQGENIYVLLPTGFGLVNRLCATRAFVVT